MGLYALHDNAVWRSGGSAPPQTVLDTYSVVGAAPQVPDQGPSPLVLLGTATSAGGALSSTSSGTAFAETYPSGYGDANVMHDETVPASGRFFNALACRMASATSAVLVALHSDDGVTTYQSVILLGV